MKAVMGHLFKRFAGEEIEREIEEELRFHLELLTQEHLQHDLSLAQAKEAALKRFGDVEQIKGLCAEITRSRHPLIRASKTFFILVFLVGVLVRVFFTEPHFMQVGDILIFIAILGRLFLYVRGLNPSSFHSKHETLLMLNSKAQTSVPPYDHRKLTPVERVITDK